MMTMIIQSMAMMIIKDNDDNRNEDMQMVTTIVDDE